MKKIVTYKFAFFILLCLLASCSNENKKENKAHAQHNVQDVYTCSMHPEIIRNEPGNCPVCGMTLVKKESGNKAVHGLEPESLLQPANEFVASSIPVTTIEQKEEDVELNVVGTVTLDTRQVGAISSRVKGRIEKLYIRYKYQAVRKGQRVMDIYSPELLTAQQNLIFLLKNDSNNTSLINAAKSRLLLMGMTGSQVAEVVVSKSPKYAVGVFSNYSGFVTDITPSSATTNSNVMQTESPVGPQLTVKEGMYIQSGQAVFSVYNSARAWVLLDIYPDQQNLVMVGNAVRITPETNPEKNFRAKIDYIEPLFRPGTKTLGARVYFNNASMQLPIGSRVTANIFATSVKASWLRKEAVLSLGRDKIVFLKEPGGFRAHKVITGMELNRAVQVISGLSANDSVASNAHFLVDNEAFIKISK